MMEKHTFSGYDILSRPRRNRQSASIRALVRETSLQTSNLVMPYFVIPGKHCSVPIPSMPGIEKLSVDLLCREIKTLQSLGISAVALFPVIPDSLKDAHASEGKNPLGLLPTAVRAVKEIAPDMTVITDVAMDPYSSDGHDGIVSDGRVLNDASLPILAEMAVAQARAGADMVAPSDMMDGRVGVIRRALDDAGFETVGILSYAVKYASVFYGPFRDALDSRPRSGDKKTYQMDPANGREALREVLLDVEQGADIVMVKPALAYLDVIRAVQETVHIPVAAYHVSGEYSMIKAAAREGWVDEIPAAVEVLTCIKRAGARMIFTYFAKTVAKVLG
jgi:porphobilinogen synthase